MKKRFYCPACGTREATNLFITTQKGKSLSLHLSSQANIRKSTGEVCCVVCRHVGKLREFQNGREEEPGGAKKDEQRRSVSPSK